MKKTTSERDPAAAQRLRDLIRDISFAMVTTVIPDGALHSRPMVTQEFDADGELWFMMSDDSAQAQDLAEEQGVNVSYADPVRLRFVSVSGNASVVRDTDKLHEMWKPGMEKFLPKGLDDPHLALMRVRIETAEYWDASVGAMVSLHDQPGTNRGGTTRAAGEHTQVDIRRTQASG